MSTIAVFGAGPGLGRSVARRFGREGFRVALVARRRERLDAYTAELAEEGIEAVGFPADLRDRARLPGLIEAIGDALGPIDVMAYGAATGDVRPCRPLDVEPDAWCDALDLPVLAPVTLANALAPAMAERRDGTLLFALGSSALHPMPMLTNLGMAGAALRNYVHALHADLAPHGVYAGALTIGGLIERSDVHRMVAAGADTGGLRVELLNPDELADHYWDMHTKRDRVEDEVGLAL